MKIEFEDGSFLEIIPQDKDDKIATIILCGLKSSTEITMSSSGITREQATKIIKLLQELV